jgi:lantibiotic biosynthesis protein
MIDTLSTKKRWLPILKKEAIKKQLEVIANTLEKSVADKEYSLLTGSSGVALFFYDYWLYTGKDKYLEKGNAIILENFSHMAHPLNNLHSLCSGTAGFMWTVNFLINNNFIEGDCNELFLEKEPYLDSIMVKNIKEGKYDYLHKALGIGLYFIKRNNKQSIRYVNSLICELEKIAEKDINGLKWRSTIEDGNESKEVYNLCLSHGIASIIAFLSNTYKNDIAKSKTKELLMGAVSFLLASKFDVPSAFNGSYFPSYILVKEENIKVTSRLAWCYGDLGIGIALWQASQVLQNAEWENTAIDVLLQTTTRRDTIKEFVKDAGICHGSAGIAHIYNRMHQYTGKNAFKDAAIYWLQDTLKKATFPDGLAGYKTWRTEEHGGWINDAGLLEGIAGIGLVLLSAITDIEPKWDECLLLS